MIMKSISETLSASNPNLNPNPEYKELNELLINNINDLGIINLSLEVDLIYYLLVFAVSLFLSTALCFAFKGIKYVVVDEKDYILAEVNSCTRFIVQRCLDDEQFRNNSIKLISGVLVCFSIIGALIGSAMCGITLGVSVLCAFYYQLYQDILKEETQNI